MIAYGENGSICRRKLLLEYLGETGVPERCSGCDICVAALEVPWAAERAADVPNPSQLFDPSRVTLELVEANVGRAEMEGRGPLGIPALKCILTGNAYPLLQREPSPHLRRWKDRRLRAFPQWGLLSSLPHRDEAIENAIRGLEEAGLVERARGGDEEGFQYQYLRPTEAGLRLLERGEPLPV